MSDIPLYFIHWSWIMKFWQIPGQKASFTVLQISQSDHLAGGISTTNPTQPYSPPPFFFCLDRHSNPESPWRQKTNIAVPQLDTSAGWAFTASPCLSGDSKPHIYCPCKSLLIWWRKQIYFPFDAAYRFDPPSCT